MSDNLAIWNAVCKTNPANTKHVNQRGGFTAINANSQIMEATRQFGPIGIGWGYTTGAPIFHDTLMFVPVTLWHGDRANTFGPMLGCEEWKDSKGRVDSDAGKKATTDAVTKLLSQLGFNADVFLGLYDDQKYVAKVRAEFSGASNGTATVPPELDALFIRIDEAETQQRLTMLWQDEGMAAFEKHGTAVSDKFNRRKAAIAEMDRVAA